jgi:hypothetical protein
MKTVLFVMFVLASQLAIAAERGYFRFFISGIQVALEPPGSLYYLPTTVVRDKITWSATEPTPGVFDFSSTNRHVVRIDGFLAAGLDVVLTVKSDAPWAVVDGSCSSSPPVDLEDYRRFIREVARYFGNRIDHYVIENEVHEPSRWCGGNMDEYIDVLRVAREEVRSINAEARISDSGIQGTFWSWAYIRALLDDRRDAEALSVYSQLKGESIRINKLKKAVRNKFSKSQVIKNAQALLNLGLFNYVDVRNFHYYQPSGYLADIVGFIRSHGPADLPIMTNEYGDRSDTVTQAAAEYAAKTCILQGLGVGPVLWLSQPGSKGAHTGAFKDVNNEPVWEMFDAYRNYASTDCPASAPPATEADAKSGRGSSRH